MSEFRDRRLFGGARRSVNPVGARTRAIWGGSIPLARTRRAPENMSRDKLCVVNASKNQAHPELQIDLSDRDPAGPRA